MCTERTRVWGGCVWVGGGVVVRRGATRASQSHPKKIDAMQKNACACSYMEIWGWRSVVFGNSFSSRFLDAKRMCVCVCVRACVCFVRLNYSPGQMPSGIIFYILFSTMATCAQMRERKKNKLAHLVKSPNARGAQRHHTYIAPQIK